MMSALPAMLAAEASRRLLASVPLEHVDAMH